MMKRTGSILLAAVMSVSMLGIPGSTVLADDTAVIASAEEIVGAEDTAANDAADKEIGSDSDEIADAGFPDRKAFGTEEADKAEESVGTEEADRAEEADGAETVGELEAAEETENLDEGTEVYWNPGDWKGLPGWSYHIERWDGSGAIVGEEYEEYFEFEITNITPVSANWDRVLEIEKGYPDGDQSADYWWWDIRGKNLGSATLKISGKKENGQKISYNINYEVVEDVYGFRNTDAEPAQDYYLSGEEFVVRTEAYHSSSVQERDGDLSNVTYEWTLSEGAEVVREFIPGFEGDPLKAKVVLGELPFEQESAEVFVEVNMYDEHHNTLCKRSGWVVELHHEYSELYPTGINGDMFPGESEKVTAELRDYSDITGGYETRKNIEFRWYYDPEDVVVLDSHGNRVGGRVGEYVESDYAKASPETGGCDFTIRRLNENDTGIVLMAVEGEDKTAITEKHYQLYRQFTDIWPEEYEVDFYTDSTDEHPVRIEIGDLAERCDVVYRIGFWDNEEWKGDLAAADYSAVIHNNWYDFTLKNNYLNSLQMDTDIRVWVGVYLKGSLHTEDNLLSETDAWFHVYLPRTEYELPQDRSMLPGWEDDIFGHYDVSVWDSDHPDGTELEYDVTNVEIIEDNPWNPEEGNVIEYLDPDHNPDDPDDYWWHFKAAHHGDAVLKVTYRDLEGRLQTHDVHIYVGADVYNMRLDTADGVTAGLPGTAFDLYADVWRNNEDGDHSIDNVWMGWTILEGREYVTLKVDQNDDKHATATFGKLPEGEYSRNIRIKATAYRGEFEEIEECVSEEIVLWLTEDFIQVIPAELPRDLNIGESFTATWEIRHYSVDNKDGYEVLEVPYYWSYDESCVTVTDKDGNIVGNEREPVVGKECRFTITRNNTWRNDVWLHFVWQEELGNLINDNYRYELNDRNYSIDFERGWVSVYDDYQTTIAPNTDDLNGVNGYEIRYEVENYEGEPVKEGSIFTVENNAITIYGSRLAEERMEGVNVCAIAFYNGEQLSNETWCSVELQTACRNGQHFWCHGVYRKPTVSEPGVEFDVCALCLEVRRTEIPKLIDISKAKVTGVTDKEYTGKAITQTPKVVVDGKTLKLNTDYKLTYKNNTKVGQATMTITGIGLYGSKKNVKFKINPKGTTLSSLTPASKALTVKWKKQATQTTGYEVQYSTSKTFASGNKTVTIKKNSTVSTKLTKLKSKKTYYVRIRTYKTVSGKQYYSAWSKALNAKTK